ncbi:TRAP transporter fused permease subunit (plasmid) [Parasedimentitalea marina]|uniref:TRAP transporter fused permease subunit n=1 Tax=Parasedimentitalea marina TaxID=2483033 RepID=A0A3T0NA56_9RHOB|nr:TRAP transporter fused permease subunit [Parasedimentitalea marina]AZV80855.1 TRAP transporter fused permease subunit [Parasedimentitalea marina]
MSNIESEAAIGRFRTLGPGWTWPLRLATCVVVLLAINQAFNLHFLVGKTLLANQYMYMLLLLIIPTVFILLPISNGASKTRVPIYDFALAALTVAVLGWFIANSLQMMQNGWELAAPLRASYISMVLWLLIFEASRRAGGTALAVIVAVVSLYPLFAELMPGPIRGFSYPVEIAAGYHAMSNESIVGIPLRAFSNLVIGFLIFGAALQHTGAGTFFINLAFALLGHIRGGPAKVAIVASGLMGSMSGSVVTNVMTTGVMTIPAMRRIKLSAPFAAGVEACASTGGVLMPPVMGATAFIMANFLEVSYASVALAAVIPSFLYFFGLFVQIDARAASENIQGLDRSELPSVRQTLKDGWYYIFAFALLVYLLLFLRREMLAPFYATPVLLIINQVFSKTNRWGRKELLAFVDTLTTLFAELVGILAGIGLIIGALSMTGLAGTLVNDLLSIAGGSPMVLLVIGAMTSFILGIGMTVTAAYIFLAIILAPALISTGMNPMAVHMFIFYWGMLSFITPPVALGAFAAASVAKAAPMATGLEAMRLGSVIYFIPFFFVLDPALILVGSASQILVSLGLASFGVLCFASAMQGYLVGVGRLKLHERALLIAGAIIMPLPGHIIIPLDKIQILGLSAVAILPVMIWAFLREKQSASVGAQT